MKLRFSTLFTIAISALPIQASLELTLSDTGISSISYQGESFHAPAAGQAASAYPSAKAWFETRGVDTQGHRTYAFTEGTTQPLSTTVFANAVTRRYSWGRITARYTVNGNRLDIESHLVNETPDKVLAKFELSLLHLAHREGWKNLGNEITSDRFGYVGFQDAVVKVLAVNESFEQPIKIGMNPCGNSCGRPVFLTGDTSFPDTVERTTHPHGMPRIASGDSLVLQLSLTFAAASQTDVQMIGDLLPSYRQSLAPLQAWPDRRPIAMLFHSSNFSGHRSATNPRGYFNDPKVDIVSDAGKAAWKTRMLTSADNTIANIKKMGGQGLIWWDIEGQEHPHPTSFIGDPRMAKIFAPEMDAIADEYLKKYTDAGLRIGFCLRPTRVYYNEGEKKWRHNTGSDGGHQDGNTPHAVYQHLKPEDLPWWRFFPTLERMADKIEYCRKRWGATLFYIDTPGEYRPLGEANAFTYVQLNTWVYRELSRRFPDVSIIPEFVRQSDLGFGGKYMELDLGGKGTSDWDRAVFPEAVAVVNITDGAFGPNRSRLMQAVEEGDIMMFHGWWWPSKNDSLKALYDEAVAKGVRLVQNPVPGVMRGRALHQSGHSDWKVFVGMGTQPMAHDGRQGFAWYRSADGRLVRRIEISAGQRWIQAPEGIRGLHFFEFEPF